MKLYGLKLERNKDGKEVALVELTKEEIRILMMCANAADLHFGEKGQKTAAELCGDTWTQLYKIKYSNLWKE